MPRARDPNRDKAFEIWKSVNGEISNRALAEQLGIPEKTIGSWKSKDNWNGKLNGVLQTKIRSTPNKNSNSKKARSMSKKTNKEPDIESEELTEKQRLFCLYYVKYRNKTKAYMKAYKCTWENANSHAYKLWGNVGVKSEIDRLLKELRDELKLDTRDILQKYIDIAFADITDFVEFGLEEATDDLGNPYEVNRVKFRDSSEVDGTIITEVKQGKDGVSVKLADKMKALEHLSKYTDLLSDNERQRLKDEKIKAETERIKMETNSINKGKTDSTLKIEIDYGDDDE